MDIINKLLKYLKNPVVISCECSKNSQHCENCNPAKLKFIEIKIYYFNILQMGAALFDASEFTQYDPTQEPIFPSELQVKKFIS